MSELERLKAWMADNDLKMKPFAKKMEMPYITVYMMLSRRNRLSASFKVRFIKTFGYQLALSIFDPFDTKSQPDPNREQVTHPHKYAAHQALARARYRKEILPAKAYKCHGCDKQAAQHHHCSYHPDDNLCVVPLCRSCHGKANRGSLDVDYGVVPTGVGLVRIAIATAP